MSDPFVGEIQAFPFTFATGGFNNAWLPCFGQLLPIQRYSPLFALIGTYYGGNGTTNFQLPNLSGCITNGQGNGPGLQPRVIGETMGSSTVSLMSAELPSHTHNLQLGSRGAENAAPGPGTAGTMVAIDPAFNGFVDPPANVNFAPNAVTATGQNIPHDNMQPTQALIWCICYAGVFPPFNNS
ncbi:tail fiber protein [Bradyrhizobium sp. STM 3809]|uniref:phage tail protein n=1 Tax=Bradyrhizobium sp. STM 3809 TaxID=551936 RepID=UPI0002407BAA|nr:tail fiber protein [Bradyrhizobium sp. STM 3809]CCD97792.1 Phage Tail Collar [Bradyrhizobium sp. STM 3809]